MPSNFTLSPISLEVSILGPSMTANWSVAANDSVCGTYSVLPVSNGNYEISVAGSAFTLSSPKLAVIGTHNQVMTLQRDDNTTQIVTATLSIKVTPCLVTALSLDSPPASTELKVGIDS